MKRIIGIGLAFVIVTIATTASGKGWPHVTHQKFVFKFVQGESEAFSTTIRSTTGSPVYRLDCAGGDGFRQLPTHDDDWSGGLECHLLPVKPEAPGYESLLVSGNDPSVSSGRAVFLAYMLKGRCATYPSWGLTREFRLRGMKIVLALSDVVFQPYTSENFNGFKAAKLSITVTPDSAATSRLALPAPYGQPRVLNPEESDMNEYRVDCGSR